MVGGKGAERRPHHLTADTYTCCLFQPGREAGGDVGRGGGGGGESVAARLVEHLTEAMGKIISKIFGNKEMRILMLGLDAAGKTSILFTRLIVYMFACISYMLKNVHNVTTVCCGDGIRCISLTC